MVIREIDAPLEHTGVHNAGFATYEYLCSFVDRHGIKLENGRG
mgnify:CR=1